MNAGKSTRNPVLMQRVFVQNIKISVDLYSVVI
jgi:hypothetical protein